MFSSFVSRISTSIRKSSPKALLASCLATSLSVFFQVDPDAIESNLLTDTKIVLHDIQVKPQQSGGTVLVGEVDEIEFTWTWGGDGATSFVRETRLCIRGARFRIVAAEEPQQETTEEPTKEQVETDQSSQQEQTMGYIQRHVQQIVDHLTLDIEDFQLTIEASAEHARNVVLEARSLQLITLGREKTLDSPVQDQTDSSSNPPPPPLVQRISLESFCAYVVQSATTDEETTRFPLLEPFGYAASVKRVSGRRFVDGLGRGLEVVGQVAKSIGEENAGMVLQAGTTQVQALNRIMEMLLPSGERLETENTGDEDGVAGGFDLQRDPLSTTFLLPLPSVKLVLPNGSSVQMPDCTFHYRTDGTECNLQGTKGIVVDQECPFVELCKQTRWLLDFTNKNAILEQHDIDTEAGAPTPEQGHSARQRQSEHADSTSASVATVHWRELHMNRLMSGIREIVHATSPDVLDRAESLHEAQPSSGSAPWSFAVNGSILFSINSADEKELIEATVESPYVVLSQDGPLPSRLRIAGATLEPRSFGVSLHVPPIVSVEEKGELCLQGDIVALLQSAAEASNAQKFLQRVLGFEELKSTSAVSDEVVQVPFPVILRSIQIDVAEEKLHVVVNNARLFESNARCDLVKFFQDDGISASVSNVNISLKPYIEMNLRRMETLSIPGVMDLVEPVCDTAVSFRDGSLQVEVVSMSVVRSSKRSSKVDAQEDIAIPFPVRVRLQELQMKPSTETSLVVRFLSVDVTATSVGKNISIRTSGTIRVRVTESKNHDWLESSIESSSVVLSRDGLSGKYLPDEAMCDGIRVGPSSYGQVSAHVPSIYSRAGKKGFQVGGIVNVILPSIEVIDRLQTLLKFAVGHENTSITPSKDSSLILKSMAVPEVKLHVVESAIEVQAHGIHISGSTAQCLSMSYLDGSGLTASIHNVIATFKTGMKVKLGCLETLHIPGMLDLAESIYDAMLSFVGGTLYLDLDSLSVISSITAQQAPKQATRSSAIDKEPVLPFPVQLRLKRLGIMPTREASGCVSLSSIDVVVSPDRNAVSVSFLSGVRVRVEAGEDWLDSLFNPPSCVVSFMSDGFTLTSMRCPGIQVGPSSYEHVTANIPSVELRSGTRELCFAGVVDVTLPSVKATSRIQTLLKLAVGYDSSATPHVSDDSVGLSLSICVPEANVRMREPSTELHLRDIRVLGESVQCNSMNCLESSGLVMSLTGIHAAWAPVMKMKVHQIQSFNVPNLCSLSEPICETTVSFIDGALSVEMPSVSVIVAEQVTRQATRSSTHQEEMLLPFPVQLHFQALRLLSSGGTNSCVSFSAIDAVAVQVGKALSIDFCDKVGVRVEAEGEWLESQVVSASMVLSPSSDGFSLQSLNCASVRVGPCTCGHISVDIPSIELLPKTDEFHVGGVVNVSLQSVDTVISIQSLVKRAFSHQTSDESTRSTSVRVPRVLLNLQDPKIEVITENFLIRRSDVYVERILLNNSNGMSASVSGVKGTFAPELKGELEWIEALCLPGTCSLEKPIKGTTLGFVGETLGVFVPSANVTLLGEGVKAHGSVASRETVAVPFHMRLDLPELSLKSSLANSDCTSFHGIALNLKPLEDDPFSNAKNQQGTKAEVSVHHLENSLVKLENARVTGIVYNEDQVNNFSFSAGSTSITAGFSSVDWSQMLGKEAGEEPRVVMLPFACIEKFKAHLSYQGKVVSARETAVLIPRFQGGPDTTSNDVLQHLTTAVLSRAPSFITNAEIFGANVVESTAQGVGMMTMSKTMTGSAAGSVTGLVAVDGIRGAIASGKKARNAEGDKYKFGDFTRGAVRSISQATKSGGELRRGSSDKYVVGDFTAGASRSMGQYVGENKSRFGAAGGSSVGMIVGTAVAGPLGFVAGSLIGGKLGGQAFEDSAATSSETNSQEQTAGATHLNASSSLGPSNSSIENRGSSVFPDSSTSSNSEPSRTTTCGDGNDTDLLGLGPPRSTHPTSIGGADHSSITQRTHNVRDGNVASASSMAVTTPYYQQAHQAETSSPRLHNIRDTDLLGLDVSHPSAGGTDSAAQYLHASSMRSSTEAPGYAPTTRATPAARQHPTHQQGPPMHASSPYHNSGVSHNSMDAAASPQPPHHVGRYGDGVHPPQHQQQQLSQPHHQDPRGVFTQHPQQYPQDQRTTGVYQQQQQYLQHRQNPRISGDYALRQQQQHDPRFHPSEPPKKEGYRFGDITRSVIAKGKKKNGRNEKDGYKFGDFTRGLFK